MTLWLVLHGPWLGCNDCTNPGGSLTEPAFLQTWMDDGNTLKLTGNASVSFKGTPGSFTAKTCGPNSHGQWSHSHIQTPLRCII